MNTDNLNNVQGQWATIKFNLSGVRRALDVARSGSSRAVTDTFMVRSLWKEQTKGTATIEEQIAFVTALSTVVDVEVAIQAAEAALTKAQADVEQIMNGLEAKS
jgi:hypothetical protein